jgi:hypothetical protein
MSIQYIVFGSTYPPPQSLTKSKTSLFMDEMIQVKDLDLGVQSRKKNRKEKLEHPL